MSRFALTQHAVRKVAALVKRGETRPRRLRGRDSHVDVAAPSARWWRVVASVSIATNRWEYTLQDLDDDTDEVLARNKMEDANTASVAGPSYDLLTLPSAFELLPIGKTLAGATIECVVEAWPEDDGDGNEQWWFSKVNIVDGECESTSDDDTSGYPPQLGHARI